MVCISGGDDAAAGEARVALFRLEGAVAMADKDAGQAGGILGRDQIRVTVVVHIGDGARRSGAGQRVQAHSLERPVPLVAVDC